MNDKMNKVNKVIMRIFVLLVMLVIPLLTISAENLTTNETIVVNETEYEEPVCEERLELCLEDQKDIKILYNNLVKDFRDGVNCGTATTLIKGMNEVLAEERNACREEIGAINVYRVGFYILLGMLVIIATIIIITAMKKKE